jgi:hypothetical protein
VIVSFRYFLLTLFVSLLFGVNGYSETPSPADGLQESDVEKLPIPAPETPKAEPPKPIIELPPAPPTGGTAPGSVKIVAPDPVEIVVPGEKRLRFNFKHVPWKDVINWFAEQAELSLQADNVPSGTLNLTDNRYYTPNEALDILNSYLLFKE